MMTNDRSVAVRTKSGVSFFHHESLPDLGGDGLGVHLVGRGSFLQHPRGIAPRYRQQNRGFNQSPPQGVLVCAAKVGGKCLGDSAVVPFLPNAMLPYQHLKAGLFQETCQPLDDKKRDRASSAVPRRSRQWQRERRFSCSALNRAHRPLLVHLKRDISVLILSRLRPPPRRHRESNLPPVSNAFRSTHA